jgi:hypothetical protein
MAPLPDRRRASGESEAHHTLKNQLAIILGYCDLLLTEMDPADARREDLLEIQRAAKGALALVNAESGA